jgi:hypothetical protein
VSGYGLDRGSIPGRGERIFPVASVQTGSGAHSASCTMGTGSPFPGGKTRPGRDADHLLHLMPRSRMSRSYPSSPTKRLRGVYWNNFSCSFNGLTKSRALLVRCPIRWMKHLPTLTASCTVLIPTPWQPTWRHVCENLMS